MWLYTCCFKKDVNYIQTIKVVTIIYIHCSFRGVGAKLKVLRLNFMVSSWQVLWTELKISAISDNNSVLKAAHAKGCEGMPLPGKFWILVHLK